MLIKTFAAASLAASMLLSGAAFAQETQGSNTGSTTQGSDTGTTNAPNAAPYAKPDMMSDTAYDYFADRNTGMWRADDDFTTRWGAASPEDQAMLRDTCTELQKDQTLFTDTVSSRCKMITGPSGG